MWWPDYVPYLVAEDRRAGEDRAPDVDRVRRARYERGVAGPDERREESEQRGGEEALRQSEQRLRLALRAGGMGSWEWDLVSGDLHWSETLERIHGLEPGTFGGTFDEYGEGGVVAATARMPTRVSKVVS